MRERSRKIRNFIIDKVEKHPKDIGLLVAEKFGISRQAASKHLSRLSTEGILNKIGATKARSYELANIIDITKTYRHSSLESEDVIWRECFLPSLKDIVPKNVLEICQYGFTEMLNNVIDHSEAKRVIINVRFNSKNITIMIMDSGIGVFQKIQSHFKLEDQRQAILELAKGKLTSDPERHSGEGIFFSSRMFDQYTLSSDKISYIRFNEDDWLVETFEKAVHGTEVFMSISIDSKREMIKVFDKYASGDGDYSFNRTHVPVELARYEGEKLVSRSQAKRLLARFDRFKEVFLNFKGVESIGQAFADEVFRVFRNENPDIKIVWVNTTPEVDKMIQRAISAASGKSEAQLNLFKK